MDDAIYKLVFAFLEKAYNNAGPEYRILMILVGGFWVLFAFVYLLLPLYDKIHKKEIIEIQVKENEKAQNFPAYSFFWAIIASFVSISYTIRDVIDIGEWLYLPLPIGRFRYVFGAVLLIVGLRYVIWGRLCLNGYWTNYIYDYHKLGDKHKLIQEGAYAQCRNPIYYGQALMFLGTAIVLNFYSILFATLFPIIANVSRVKKEEKYLAEDFGAEWVRYKNITPRFMPRHDSKKARKVSQSL